MSINPMETLILHFSQYMTGKLGRDDWKTITREFGTREIAADTTRFYRSKYFGDEDEADRTIQFLDEVLAQDEQVAMRLMKRAYDMTGGADSDEIEKYPTLSALEQDDMQNNSLDITDFPVKVDSFIEIDSVSGEFYPELIQNINRCYRTGIYDASLVLTRKLLENLLIDILRSQYGTDRIEIYYDTDRKQFQPFYELVSSFESNIEDFHHYSTEIDGGLIEDLNSFRKTANRGAHSLEVNISDDEINRYGEKATKTARILFRIKRLA